jgi:hypothetical protein
VSDSYLIAYDLGGPERDYEELIDAIKSYGYYAHILESNWIVRSNDSASDIRDDLKPHIDLNDKLLVVECGSGWATTFSNDNTEWMHDNFNK